MTSRSERLLRLVALFCFGAVGVALISQHAFDMPPCAWCVMQRLIYLVIGVVALVGSLGGGRALTRVCGALAALLGLAGVVAAWYQYSVAAKMLSCDQTFADRFMSGAGLTPPCPGCSASTPPAWTRSCRCWAWNTRCGAWRCSWSCCCCPCGPPSAAAAHSK